MPPPATQLGAGRTAALLGDFDRSPAWSGLAEALTLLIGDGRLPGGARLPSERELTGALDVSRTTVTRAYAALVEAGYAEARRGSGTYTRVPGGRARAHDRVLVSRHAGAGDGDDGDGTDLIDLGVAAGTAPPQLAAAYADAVRDLPAYLGGTGYFPTGLPALRGAIAASYDARGLPTDPDQVVVTPGALSAIAVAVRALLTTGDRVLVETPTYPNAVATLRAAGARLLTTPVGPDGWDLDVTTDVLRRARPRLAYLVPDFHNPTGLLVGDEQREQCGALLRRVGTVPLVDETLQPLALDVGLAEAMPLPLAAHVPDAVTVGSASKAWWGGLRLGWLRVPHAQVGAMVQARVSLDLGAPVLEQLVLTRLLTDPGPLLEAQRLRLREQRDALVTAVTTHLPEWRFEVPRDGLSLWCELPVAAATAVCAEAETRGVVATPGPVFAVEGGLDRWVRLPWARPVADLEQAVARLAAAWDVVRRDERPAPPRGGRVMVA